MTRKRTTTLRVASSRAVDDFKIIRGIGPLYEKHLHDAGIRKFVHLAKKTPEDVATHIPNLSASQIRKQGWVLQARKLVSKNASNSHGKASTVSTTSQHYENFTVEFLLNEKNKLRRLRIMHVQSGDVETWAIWKVEEVSHFLARHTGTQIPEGNIQKLEVSTAKTKSPVKATKSVMSAEPKSRHRSSTRKSAKPENKTQPKKTPRKPEVVSAPKEKKEQAKSAQPKAKRSRISVQKSVKPVVKTPSKKLLQKSESLTIPDVEKVKAKSVIRKTKQSRSKARETVKPIVKVPPNESTQIPETSLAPEINQGQAKSVKPEGKESRSSEQKSVDKPAVETPLKEITQTPEAQIVSKVKQDLARSTSLETGQSKNSVPIQFRPADEVIPKRFLQKSITSPVQEEIKHQADSSQPEVPQSEALKEIKSQMGAIRLLRWNNFMADSDQPVQSLPHNQSFDVKLTLDISGLPITAKSQLDITGILVAKKLGTHQRSVIGETQVVLPYSPIVNLRVGNAALEQGLYRLEAEVKLKDYETVSLPNGIDTVFQGGLFQVY